MKKNHPSISGYEGLELFNAFEKPTEQAIASHARVTFIGNSLTLHGPAPEIGWMHHHGMAASEPSADYVHQVLKRLEIPPDQSKCCNLAEIERGPFDVKRLGEWVEQLIPGTTDLTIIQLGDNVASNAQLQHLCDNLCTMLPLLKTKSKSVLLLSTWWESPPKDGLLRKLCELFSIRYVHIGDIFSSPENADRKVQRHTHAGVNNHPGDWGMAQIALRVQDALLTGTE